MWCSALIVEIQFAFLNLIEKTLIVFLQGQRRHFPLYLTLVCTKSTYIYIYIYSFLLVRRGVREAQAAQDVYKNSTAIHLFARFFFCKSLDVIFLIKASVLFLVMRG
jgi:hypothetical protein